jgi:vitamin B12 transporter
MAGSWTSNRENVMRKSLCFSSAILVASAMAPARAADATANNIPENVVVTATRTEQSRELTGTSISVITAEDLTTEQIVVVTDALRETPGLTVVRNGGVGQTTTIGIRGAQAGQTLVLT